MKKEFCPLFWLPAALLALLAAPALASIDTVKSPSIREGALEFKYKSKFEQDDNPKLDDNKETEIGLGYGSSKNWKTEIEANFVDKPGVDFEYRKFKLQNYVRLMEEGAGAFFDLALYGELALADQAIKDTHTTTFGFAAAKKLFGATHTGDLLLRRDFGATEQPGANLILRWQSRYEVSPAFAPALEVFYDNLRKDHLRDQALRLGPTISGKLPFDGPAQKISYDLGYFFGATRATPSGTLRWILKYEF